MLPKRGAPEITRAELVSDAPDYVELHFFRHWAQSLLVLGILSAVTAFGLTALSYGIWQMKTGKRDARVVLGMVGLWTALVLVAFSI